MPSLLKKEATHFTVAGMAQLQMGLDTCTNEAAGPGGLGAVVGR